MHDIIIKNGLIYDGAGGPGFPGEIGIKTGNIATVAVTVGGPAPKIIDAAGLTIAPGFIDIKTHSDFTLPINPKAESKVRQGVTTEIVGHCGFSVAPALPGKVDLLKDYLSPSAPWTPFRELTFAEYLDSFPKTSVNAGMLVGHNTLRLMVLGMEKRAPTADELNVMISLLQSALEAGALGMSSGLFTPPGSYAEPSEIHALGKVLKRYNAGYFTHLRDESNDILQSIDEAIAVAKTCDIHVEIVHLKCSGTDSWGKAQKALEMIAIAKARGLDVDCDAYPYTAGSNPLKNLLPQWVQSGGVPQMIDRLKLPETRARIRNDIDRSGLNNWGRIPSWECVQISISPNLPHHVGRTIQSLAVERALNPIDTLCDYLIEDQGATRVLVASISEQDVECLVASPLALVGSDGNCVAPYGQVGRGMPHPRFYGTFPRIIDHYVRERRALPLELAIHKMTGASARALRLKNRGLIREGYRADLTLFDPAQFRDRATYLDPHQFPTGDRTTVIVNGEIVVEDSTHTGALPGQVLRRNSSGEVC